MADANRIVQDIESLNKISAPCEAGVTRTGFTPAYRKGVEYFKNQLLKAGLQVREDTAGNVYGRREGLQKGLPAIVSGSHLDTVFCAGAYDGIAGAVCALEAARMLQENRVELQHPYEVLGFMEEEGTRLGQALLGSKFITGVYGASQLDTLRDAQGVTLGEIMDNYAVEGAVPACRQDDEIAAFLELHSEQGPVLEAAGTDIGIVKTIVAIARFTVEVLGEAGHAGTVPMGQRQDAGAGAASLIAGVMEYTRDAYTGTAVATVGQLELLPGSPNCIPSRCIFSIDLRAEDMAVVDDLTAFVKAKAAEIARQQRLQICVGNGFRQDAVEMDAALREVLCSSCNALGYTWQPINSGAGHDAMVMRGRWPAAMLFVPCKRGISHNPAEYVHPDLLVKGTNVLYHAVLALDAKL